MRRSIVSLIARKEIRDLLRDRRSVFVTVLLSVLLYPLFGGTGVLFAMSLKKQETVVGVVGREHLAATSVDPAKPLPPLLDGERFAELSKNEQSPLVVKVLEGDPAELLKSKASDALLVVPEGFGAALERNETPRLRVLSRDGDEKSKLAAQRLHGALGAWEQRVKSIRFERQGLRSDFDRQFAIDDPQTAGPPSKKAATDVRDLFVRLFPFVLTLWIVAGAMQPAVDLTAGEKERGTMETLLISPVERSEIVAGKFLAVAAFSFAAALWNALWLTASGLVLQWLLDVRAEELNTDKVMILNLSGLVGCIVLAAPTAMFFAAISIALGVFARSTKEGQYYLVPLMLATMPIAFSSTVPGIELTPATSVVPVMGSLLLQQKLLSSTGDPIPWGYFVPVLGSLSVCVAGALAFAAWQFRRESVLFRDTGPTRRKRRWLRR